MSFYDPASKGAADVWNKVAGPVRQRLCVEWDWCQVRQDARWENDLDLAIAVLGVLSARVLHLPIPADLALIAAIVVKRGLKPGRRMNSSPEEKAPQGLIQCLRALLNFSQGFLILGIGVSQHQRPPNEFAG